MDLSRQQGEEEGEGGLSIGHSHRPLLFPACCAAAAAAAAGGISKPEMTQTPHTLSQERNVLCYPPHTRAKTEVRDHFNTATAAGSG